MPKDLHSLPKLRDSLTYIYLEKAVIEQDAMYAVVVITIVLDPVDFQQRE